MKNMGAKFISKFIISLANLITCAVNGNFPSVRVRPHRNNPRNTLLKAILWLLLVIIPSLLPPPGALAAQRPFALRYTANSNGDIFQIGNSAMICNPAGLNGGACLNAQQGTGAGARLNNNYRGIFPHTPNGLHIEIVERGYG